MFDILHKQWNCVVHGSEHTKLIFMRNITSISALSRLIEQLSMLNISRKSHQQQCNQVDLCYSLKMRRAVKTSHEESNPYKECFSKSTTVLFLLPCLAACGSCLQYLSPSMYSPVNAIKSLFFSASPFIDTYQYKSNVLISSSCITQISVRSRS